MVKKISAILIVALFIGCSQKTQKAEEDYSATIEKEQNVFVSESKVDYHTANVSLDYMGTYKGIFPCADCDGLKVEIVLGEDGLFTRTIRHGIDVTKEITKESGSFVWNKEGNAVTLVGAGAYLSNRYFVGEDRLFQLDSEGNRVIGEKSDDYILTK
jgi:Uncharacterized lipoprotein NlpE involved in copper resistance